MSIIPNSVINIYKDTVDVAAIVNEADVSILAGASLQNKCLFEMIIFADVTLDATLSDRALTVLDLVMMRTYLYSINDLPLTGFEFQRSGGVQWVKDMLYTDSFNCTFLETGMGSVKGYFRRWIEQIATYTPMTMNGYTTGDYLFANNQNKSKRTAIIIPQQSDVLPSTEWIKIDGLKFKSLTGISYDHSSGENELLTAEFSCDSIRLNGVPY